MNNFAIGIVSLIVILIIIVIVTTIFRNRQNDTDKDTDDNDNINEWPTSYYMDRIGKYCPTGWVYAGNLGGKDVCRNLYNIPVNGGDICYTPNDAAQVQKEVHFPSFKKKWQDCINNPSKCRKAMNKRCNWINKCGPDDRNIAQWIGFEQHCPGPRVNNNDFFNNA